MITKKMSTSEENSCSKSPISFTEDAFDKLFSASFNHNNDENINEDEDEEDYPVEVLVTEARNNYNIEEKTKKNNSKVDVLSKRLNDRNKWQRSTQNVRNVNERPGPSHGKSSYSISSSEATNRLKDIDKRQRSTDSIRNINNRPGPSGEKSSYSGSSSELKNKLKSTCERQKTTDNERIINDRPGPSHGNTSYKSTDIKINRHKNENKNQPLTWNGGNTNKRPGSPSCTYDSKKKKGEFEPPKLKEPNRDIFCWKCHKLGTDIIICINCPRVYHFKCSQLEKKPTDWVCFQCNDIRTAESEMRSASLKNLNASQLSRLLKFVLRRMRQHDGCVHFEKNVDTVEYPDYLLYIVHPSCLSDIENNILNHRYKSCESLLADTRWLVHNSYIFNTALSDLTVFARSILKMAKHECAEILNCPDCYLHANTLDKNEWFIEPCRIPHILVWAKLKSWPFWPCKVMTSSGNNIDVRFFGDHNRAIVPAEFCFLFSREMPKKQKIDLHLDLAMEEVTRHIHKLKDKFGEFCYSPQGVNLTPKDEDLQRKILLPGLKIPEHNSNLELKKSSEDQLLFRSSMERDTCPSNSQNYDSNPEEPSSLKTHTFPNKHSSESTYLSPKRKSVRFSDKIEVFQEKTIEDSPTNDDKQCKDNTYMYKRPSRDYKAIAKSLFTQNYKNKIYHKLKTKNCSVLLKKLDVKKGHFYRVVEDDNGSTILVSQSDHTDHLIHHPSIQHNTINKSLCSNPNAPKENKTSELQINELTSNEPILNEGPSCSMIKERVYRECTDEAIEGGKKSTDLIALSASKQIMKRRCNKPTLQSHPNRVSYKQEITDFLNFLKENKISVNSVRAKLVRNGAGKKSQIIFQPHRDRFEDDTVDLTNSSNSSKVLANSLSPCIRKRLTVCKKQQQPSETVLMQNINSVHAETQKKIKYNNIPVANTVPLKDSIAMKTFEGSEVGEELSKSKSHSLPEEMQTLQLNEKNESSQNEICLVSNTISTEKDTPEVIEVLDDSETLKLNNSISSEMSPSNDDEMDVSTSNDAEVIEVSDDESFTLEASISCKVTEKIFVSIGETIHLMYEIRDETGSYGIFSNYITPEKLANEISSKIRFFRSPDYDSILLKEWKSTCALPPRKRFKYSLVSDSETNTLKNNDIESGRSTFGKVVNPIANNRILDKKQTPEVSNKEIFTLEKNVPNKTVSPSKTIILKDNIPDDIENYKVKGKISCEKKTPEVGPAVETNTLTLGNSISSDASSNASFSLQKIITNKKNPEIIDKLLISDGKNKSLKDNTPVEVDSFEIRNLISSKGEFEVIEKGPDLTNIIIAAKCIFINDVPSDGNVSDVEHVALDDNRLNVKQHCEVVNERTHSINEYLALENEKEISNIIKKSTDKKEEIIVSNNKQTMALEDRSPTESSDELISVNEPLTLENNILNSKGPSDITEKNTFTDETETFKVTEKQSNPTDESILSIPIERITSHKIDEVVVSKIYTLNDRTPKENETSEVIEKEVAIIKNCNSREVERSKEFDYFRKEDIADFLNDLRVNKVAANSIADKIKRNCNSPMQTRQPLVQDSSNLSSSKELKTCKTSKDKILSIDIAGTLENKTLFGGENSQVIDGRSVHNNDRVESNDGISKQINTSLTIKNKSCSVGNTSISKDIHSKKVKSLKDIYNWERKEIKKILNHLQVNNTTADSIAAKIKRNLSSQTDTLPPFIQDSICIVKSNNNLCSKSSSFQKEENSQIISNENLINCLEDNHNDKVPKPNATLEGCVSNEGESSKAIKNMTFLFDTDHDYCLITPLQKGKSHEKSMDSYKAVTLKDISSPDNKSSSVHPDEDLNLSCVKSKKNEEYSNLFLQKGKLSKETVEKVSTDLKIKLDSHAGEINKKHSNLINDLNINQERNDEKNSNGANFSNTELKLSNDQPLINNFCSHLRESKILTHVTKLKLIENTKKRLISVNARVELLDVLNTLQEEIKNSVNQPKGDCNSSNAGKIQALEDKLRQPKNDLILATDSQGDGFQKDNALRISVLNKSMGAENDTLPSHESCTSRLTIPWKPLDETGTEPEMSNHQSLHSGLEIRMNKNASTSIHASTLLTQAPSHRNKVQDSKIKHKIVRYIPFTVLNRSQEVCSEEYSSDEDVVCVGDLRNDQILISSDDDNDIPLHRENSCKEKVNSSSVKDVDSPFRSVSSTQRERSLNSRKPTEYSYKDYHREDYQTKIAELYINYFSGPRSHNDNAKGGRSITNMPQLEKGIETVNQSYAESKGVLESNRNVSKFYGKESNVDKEGYRVEQEELKTDKDNKEVRTGKKLMIKCKGKVTTDKNVETESTERFRKRKKKSESNEKDLKTVNNSENEDNTRIDSDEKTECRSHNNELDVDQEIVNRENDKYQYRTDEKDELVECEEENDFIINSNDDEVRWSDPDTTLDAMTIEQRHCTEERDIDGSYFEKGKREGCVCDDGRSDHEVFSTESLISRHREKGIASAFSHPVDVRGIIRIRADASRDKEQESELESSEEEVDDDDDEEPKTDDNEPRTDNNDDEPRKDSDGDEPRTDNDDGNDNDKEPGTDSDNVEARTDNGDAEARSENEEVMKDNYDEEVNDDEDARTDDKVESGRRSDNEFNRNCSALDIESDTESRYDHEDLSSDPSGHEQMVIESTSLHPEDVRGKQRSEIDTRKNKEQGSQNQLKEMEAIEEELLTGEERARIINNQREPMDDYHVEEVRIDSHIKDARNNIQVEDDRTGNYDEDLSVDNEVEAMIGNEEGTNFNSHIEEAGTNDNEKEARNDSHIEQDCTYGHDKGARTDRNVKETRTDNNHEISRDLNEEESRIGNDKEARAELNNESLISGYGLKVIESFSLHPTYVRSTNIIEAHTSRDEELESENQDKCFQAIEDELMTDNLDEEARTDNDDEETGTDNDVNKKNIEIESDSECNNELQNLRDHDTTSIHHNTYSETFHSQQYDSSLGDPSRLTISLNRHYKGFNESGEHAYSSNSKQPSIHVKKLFEIGMLYSNDNNDEARTDEEEARTDKEEARTDKEEARTDDEEARIGDKEPGTCDGEAKTDDEEPRTDDEEARTNNEYENDISSGEDVFSQNIEIQRDWVNEYYKELQNSRHHDANMLSSSYNAYLEKSLYGVQQNSNLGGPSRYTVSPSVHTGLEGGDRAFHSDIMQPYRCVRGPLEIGLLSLENHVKRMKEYFAKEINENDGSVVNFLDLNFENVIEWKLNEHLKNINKFYEAGFIDDIELHLQKLALDCNAFTQVLNCRRMAKKSSRIGNKYEEIGQKELDKCQELIRNAQKSLYCTVCLEHSKIHCCFSASYCSEKCKAIDLGHHIRICSTATANLCFNEYDNLVNKDSFYTMIGNRNMKVKDLLKCMKSARQKILFHEDEEWIDFFRRTAEDGLESYSYFENNDNNASSESESEISDSNSNHSNIFDHELPLEVILETFSNSGNSDVEEDNMPTDYNNSISQRNVKIEGSISNTFLNCLEENRNMPVLNKENTENEYTQTNFPISVDIKSGEIGTTNSNTKCNLDDPRQQSTELSQNQSISSVRCLDISRSVHSQLINTLTTKIASTSLSPLKKFDLIFEPIELKKFKLNRQKTFSVNHLERINNTENPILTPEEKNHIVNDSPDFTSQNVRKLEGMNNSGPSKTSFNINNSNEFLLNKPINNLEVIICKKINEGNKVNLSIFKNIKPGIRKILARPHTNFSQPPVNPQLLTRYTSGNLVFGGLPATVHYPIILLPNLAGSSAIRLPPEATTHQLTTQIQPTSMNHNSRGANCVEPSSDPLFISDKCKKILASSLVSGKNGLLPKTSLPVIFPKANITNVNTNTSESFE